MQYTIAFGLLVLWLVSWLSFKLLGVAVHILLVLAIVVFVMGLLRKKPQA